MRIIEKKWLYTRLMGRIVPVTLMVLLALFGIPNPHIEKTRWDFSVQAQQTQTNPMNAYQQARKNQLNGPRDVRLADVAILSLPLGYSFIPKEYAAPLLKAMGNFSSPYTLGLVVATYDMDMRWFMVVAYTPSGYIDNSNVKNWDTRELRKRLLNEIRKFPTDDINPNQRIKDIQWIIPPQYNYANHSISWLLRTIYNDDPLRSTQGQGVNYKTILFGRAGYLNVNLATSLDQFEIGKLNAQAIVSAIHFNIGERFVDFDPQRDTLAGFGIDTLIAGRAVSGATETPVETKVEKKEVARHQPDDVITSSSSSSLSLPVQSTPPKQASGASSTDTSLKTFIDRFGGLHENILLGFLILVSLLILIDTLRNKKSKKS